MLVGAVPPSLGTPNKITEPTGDGVYTGDRSPAIGTYKWNKPVVTYCLVLEDSDKFAQIPNNHDIAISVNMAFTKAELYSNIKALRVKDWTTADITIKFSSTDPIFADPSVMAYTYFPNTKPAGAFSSVFNSKILWSETGKFNFAYNINETILHECAGHGLGCVHTTLPNDIMYPFYHNSLRPSAMDIYQWQTLYGPRMPPLNPVIVDNVLKSDEDLNEFPDKPVISTL